MPDRKTPQTSSPSSLLPHGDPDPVIQVYLRSVDRQTLRENLKLTPTERLEKFERGLAMLMELRRAGGHRKTS